MLSWSQQQSRGPGLNQTQFSLWGSHVEDGGEACGPEAEAAADVVDSKLKTLPLALLPPPGDLGDLGEDGVAMLPLVVGVAEAEDGVGVVTRLRRLPPAALSLEARLEQMTLP